VCQFWLLSFTIQARIVLFEDMKDYGGRYWCGVNMARMEVRSWQDDVSVMAGTDKHR